MSAPDDRLLISTALDDTMVVEAAAGTGKTTELVGRIVRLIETERARIGEIVAVTFSEKAAGELKLRLREELERARTRHAGDAPESGRLIQAVHDFEDAHVNTIHGFCAELLRDRPVEACVDPAFMVLTESQADAIFDEAFTSWLQEALAHPGEGVRRSLRRPVRWQSDAEEQNGPIARLRRAADELKEWRDHSAAWKRPAYDRTAEIERLVEQLRRVAEITATPLKKGDYFHQDTARVRRVSHEIERLRRIGSADEDGWEAALVQLADDRDLARARKGSGTAFAAGVSRQAAHDALADLLRNLGAFRDAADADLAALLHEELRDCLERYEQRKQSAGALDFLDLLIKARDLVKNQPAVRKRFRERFRVLLVDEFQDTDPLQAELLRMLASEEGGRLRRGALFIVGDPKQSIYRFRRADVGAYRHIADEMSKEGARPVRLQTSFRSVPAIQRFVNAAFRDEMTGDDQSLQAAYVAMRPDRADEPSQPAIVALPVPRPYGRREVTLAALAESQPNAVGEFVRWLIKDSNWTVDAPPDSGNPKGLPPQGLVSGNPEGLPPQVGVRGGNPSGLPGERGGNPLGLPGAPARKRRKIVPSDICFLFRRFVHFGSDVTRPYVEALEARGVPHLLVGGKTFHEREEVDAVRVALTAIEWPEDELSVYATLHGPLFAIGEEELLEYHSIQHLFHPYRVPEGLPERLAPIARALTTLRELHSARNHRPVADTIGRLLASTRAHAGFILWRGGEQVLANVLHISDLARRYEGEGGLSFRGFVDRLRDASGRAEAPEAPILEEGSEGVRLMTVHKAKGLEFPIVILADIGCKLSLTEASRHLDAERGMCAVRIGGWAPLDLLEHNGEEAKRDEAEGVRLAYVAATRARDLLVVPGVGDGPYQKGWVRPLNRALYPPVEMRQSPSATRGCPLFSGKDSVLERPDGQQPDASTVRPGGYELVDPASGDRYSVVWWDPVLLDAPADDPRGLRREDLISKDALPEDVAADRARYDDWLVARTATQQAGSQPSVSIVTVSEWAAAQGLDAPDIDADGVDVEDAGTFGGTVSGRRFGTLVHSLLAVAPLTASAGDVAELARIHARVLTATDSERDEAALVVSRVLQHPRLDEARHAVAAGRLCRREAPVSIVRDGVLVDGQVDLAYETAEGWVVVDFKTDIELGGHEDAYRRQIGLYAHAVSRVTGKPARGVLLRI